MLPKKEKKEKQWFEKFRNFETTQGFVVVCGKDASTNDLLIKKYTSKEDIVFPVAELGNCGSETKCNPKHAVSAG